MSQQGRSDRSSATSGESIGPYRLAELLGEGGMGVVRRGTDPAGRSVAVKLLRGGSDETALRRLAREVDTMRRVRSPYVAQIVDADVTHDPPYIVTQYVAGKTLEQTIDDSGPLSGFALKRLAWGLAEALAAIHASGIVHRDLKPGNVMFAGNGDPILIDFGIAQPVDATRLTSAGMVIGTPGYLAPELLSGEDFRAPADVHAWAGTVIYAATGRPPFGNGTFEQIFAKIIQGTPDLDGVPPPLLPLLRGAMAQNPAERPTAKHVAGLVERIDLEMTMFDQTLLDNSRSVHRQPPTPTPQPPVSQPPVSPPRDMREIPRQPSGNARMPQPSDFVGQIPPVAPPPEPPQPDMYDTRRFTGSDPYEPYDPYATSDDRPYAPPPPPSSLYGPPSTQADQQWGGQNPYGSSQPYQQPYQPQQPQHGQPQHGQQGQPQQWGGDQAAGRAPETQADQDRPRAEEPKPFGLYQALGFLLLVGMLALAWAVPATAFVIAFGAATLLRAGDKAAQGTESRRTRRGERDSDLAGTLLRTPLHLPRTLISTAIIALTNLVLGMLLAAVLVGFGQGGTTSVAVGVVLAVFLQFWGMGGTATRRQLARIWGGVLPRREPAMIAVLCVGAAVAVLVLMVYNAVPDPGAFGSFANWLEDARSTVRGWIRQFS
ncbi:bifunctional serine/threonine protein kinase/MFS transporter [Actinocorallia sp. A-T 12471]|uniref:serine/threonine-protein kinase n=1 Tax=Actinocorallia sp. A-T 12471 TaxID=3089813 RepID=UPI0029CD71A3|nr:bifunctional serine/threonine protein kinase/MFS transporter [Actinocorallia sp. A-T 12471]MDX6738991.1 bifunctional serine/threonine protein kinase/MFS transporter [Actinocorallia sp. A-T 12471]